MASLYKPNKTTYQLPDGSYRTPDGKRVTKTTPGAVKVVLGESKVWFGKYRAADGTIRRVELGANKTAAKQILAKLVTDAKLGEHGMIGPYEEHNKCPLAEHLEDYRRSLVAKGNCARHVRLTMARIQTILDGCWFALIADIKPEAVAEFLHGLRQDGPRPELPAGKFWFTPREMIAAVGGRRPAQLARFLRRERLEVSGRGRARKYPRPTVEAMQAAFCRGIGISTSNGYLTAIKGFTAWLADKNRTGRDSLSSLRAMNAGTDQRHARRALNVVELRELLSAASRSLASFQGLTGPDRFMLYAMAMVSGFRASELGSLFPYSFDLAGNPPLATVQAAFSKNRKKSEQPLPLDVARALRDYMVDKPKDTPVWPGKWFNDGAEMVRQDLEAAGIPYRDEAGRVADFHSLRHSYITLLSRSGVSPKLAQELARHSDIQLTMNVYTHTGLYDLATAVESLPGLLPGNQPPETMAATGTDGRRPDRALTKPVRFPAYPVIRHETGAESAQGKHNVREATELTGVADKCVSVTTGEKVAGELGFEGS
jgi:integrase